MAISESILVALFVMAVVFSVLGILWAIIRFISFILLSLQKRTSKSSLNDK